MDLRGPLTGGFIAALVAGLGVLAVGQLSGFEARGLLEAMLPSVRFLSSALMTASATIMALMLTLLSLSHNAQSKLEARHYVRIERVAMMSSIELIGATLLLMLLSIPITENGPEIPSIYFQVLYYAVLIASALLGGFLCTIVLVLQKAIHGLIYILSPSHSSTIAFEGEGDERKAPKASSSPSA